LKLNDDILPKRIGTKDTARLREDVELIEGVYGDFDRDLYLQGKVRLYFFAVP